MKRAAGRKSLNKRTSPKDAGLIDEELGNRIRSRRLELKISQSELGNRLGLSFQQVQKYEHGTNRIGAARLHQIAGALDLPMTFFYRMDKRTREVDSLLLLDTTFSLRLLRAYCSIKNQAVQRQLVVLVEAIAGGVKRNGSKRRKRTVSTVS